MNIPDGYRLISEKSWITLNAMAQRVIDIMETADMPDGQLPKLTHLEWAEAYKLVQKIRNVTNISQHSGVPKEDE